MGAFVGAALGRRVQRCGTAAALVRFLFTLSKENGQGATPGPEDGSATATPRMPGKKVNVVAAV